VTLLIGLVAIGWTGRVGGMRWFGDAARPRLSILVLPFANLSDDPEQEYFADGISDDLTTDLSRIADSVVIAHSTAMTYKGKPVDVRQIGHDIDVRYVLEGSVRRMGDQVQVNAQLLDTADGTHVWAERFQTDRRDLAEAQSQITGRLARTLNLELVEAAGARIEREKAVDPAAADLVMRGWALWFRPFSLVARQEAVRAFDQAARLDPNSVGAKLGTASILTANVGLGTSPSPKEDSARAEGLLLQAIEQDATSTRAHEVLGMFRRIGNRLDEARIEYETAIALDRNNAHAMLGLGQTLTFLGRPEEAIPWIERSTRLDPRDPNAAFGDWSLGTAHLLLGHADAAADLLRKARAGNPRVWFFHMYLAAALGLRGDVEEARAALAEAIRLKPEAATMARWRSIHPWLTHPTFMALGEKTLDVGLRRAGMPDL
jgi:TolB-like protein/Flp pilus assembly protein TadD